MPAEPVPTLPPIAVDPVPSMPPMPSSPVPISPSDMPSAPAPAPPALATTTADSPDQELVVIEFVPIMIQPTNAPVESETECEESKVETPEPELCTDDVGVPAETSGGPVPSVPMPAVPMPSVPMPVAPMPSVPMPIVLMPSPPMPIASTPIPVAPMPIPSTPVPVVPVPSPPMPTMPMLILPTLPVPTSLAPLPPPMFTPIYQDTPVAASVDSASSSNDAPATLTDIKVVTDDTITLPYCDEEVLLTPTPVVDIGVPAMTPPAPMLTNVPAMPAPMPEPTNVPAAPVPAPMPTTTLFMPIAPAVPAPAPVPSDIASESDVADTCTPEFITVTIYDEVPVEPVTVTEYVPYFLPVDTDMWTDLYPTPPLGPGPVIWSDTPLPPVSSAPTADQPAVPAPPSSHAPCPTSSWVQV
ncbi:hypothetical protein GGI24_002261 [Coemansia furcata]|nr:hypothetical protein GGI24_002261 [Coemansia furcata]